MHQAPQCTNPTLSASSFCINYGTDCIYLRDTAVFSRGTPSSPVQKRSILQRDRASNTPSGQTFRALRHFGFRHGENDAPLLRKTTKSDSERSLGISESHRWRRQIICRQLELQNTPKMHGAPHGTHCRMVGNRSTASSRCIPEEITFELAIGYGKQKGPRA